MYRTVFLMRHFGHENEKATKLWAPSYFICLMNQGPMTKRKASTQGPATAVKYRDSNGVLRYKGTSQLKKSQSLVCKKCFPSSMNGLFREPTGTQGNNFFNDANFVFNSGNVNSKRLKGGSNDNVTCTLCQEIYTHTHYTHQKVTRVRTMSVEC